ncbi:MAG: efflux RND transporter periplasmic adaptor subunit [Spirochaetes bacterium]|nr:efflux RND transporter periplasmic adaptor subunit [Spirochaetota bacterium]
MKYTIHALLLVSALFLIDCGAKHEKPAPKQNTSGVKAKRVKAGRATISQTLEENGVLAPLRKAMIASRVSGRIKKLYAREGSFVSSGQLLASVEPDVMQARALSGSANDYEKAKLAYRSAKDNYDRKKTLAAKGFLSDTELTSAEDALRIAEMNLASSKMEYEHAYTEAGAKPGTSLSEVSVYAPIGGLILIRNVEEGEIVSGDTSARSGTTIFTIADLTSLVVSVKINEVDVYKMVLGQRVDVSIAANPLAKYQGVVSKIAPFAEDNSGIRVFPTEVTLLQNDSKLRPGMGASIKASIAAREKVLAIPVTALFIDEKGECVFMNGTNNTIVRRYIKRGINDAKNVEVLSGLAEGEEFYSDIPYDELTGKDTYVPVGGKQ